MNKIYILFFVIVSGVFFIASEDSEVNELDDANRSYIKGDYENAIISLNKHLKKTKDNELSDKAIILGEKIYYFYLRANINDKDVLSNMSIAENLELFPEMRSARISALLNQLSAGKTEVIEDNDKEMDYLSDNPVNFSVDKEYTQEELTSMLKASLLNEQEKNKSLAKIKLLLIIFIPLVIIIILACIIYVVLVKKGFVKGYKLPVYPLIQLAGEGDEELTKMLDDCMYYGDQIDHVTGRKNNSRNTAELVYKISIKSGYSEKDSIINYCAALVSDIGFLSIEKSILKSEKLTEQEFIDIKNHVNAGIALVSFIPELYHGLFVEAISKHHENMDGSGYPGGLKSDQIPFLPRVLRVVESYLSLISKRDYKAICDSEAALLQLKGEIKKYDQSIVEVLDAVI